MTINSILVFFHTPSNTGYAIAPLERNFFLMAERLTGGDWSKIHFAYTNLDAGWPTTLPEGFSNVISFDSASDSQAQGIAIENYLRANQIDTAFGFDQPVSRKMYKYLRRGGVVHFLSYQGAPMSALNGPLKLFLKKIEVAMSGDGPDHYIFESQGMADTATRGRGIPAKATSVVYLGIDPEKYYPDPAQADYVYETIGIPRDRRIFFYAGHMEQRKGVHVLVKAARILVDRYQRRDFHLLVLGNKNGEEQCFIPLMEGSRVAEHVTFGGYRNDIDRLLRGCYVGLIGSSGWDSFTLTGVEMAASGLPLVVSDLAGLNEAVDAGSTGFTFPPSNAEALAERMIYMLDQPVVRDAMGRKARERVLSGFTRDHQLEQLVAVVHRVTM